MIDTIQTSNRISKPAKSYLDLIAAKLGLKKSECMESALRMHAQYFVQIGLITPEEVGEWLKSIVYQQD